MKATDAETLPSKQTMGRGSYNSHYSGGKELSEYFTPLLGFLRKAVGRSWDKVYSEIRENLNLNSATQYHLIQHLRQGMVRFDVVMDGKIPTVPNTSRYSGVRGYVPLTSYRSGKWGNLYVNPVTGVLCSAPKTIRKPRVEHPEGWRENTQSMGSWMEKESGYYRKGLDVPTNLVDEVRVLGGMPYMKRNGVWYAGDMKALGRKWGEVTTVIHEVRKVVGDKYETVLEKVRSNGPVDMWLGSIGNTTLAKAAKFYGVANPQSYCARRGLQLSTKELMALGLRND